MTWRDPDLGRDRTTRLLGRRDWGFFADTGGVLPADRRAAAAPWGDRPTDLHDRFDRTLGIPDRHVPMWPTTTLPLDAGASILERAEAICDAICAEPLPTWEWPDPPVAAAVLRDAAPDLYGRGPTSQAAVLAAAARRHGVEPTTAWDLALGAGALVAQTTHRHAGTAAGGVPSLDALAGAAIDEVCELFLARDRLRLADALSDADLPRLWIAANGLHHGVPADILRRVPARSDGPFAQHLPWHDDLVGWAGIRPTVEHLRDVVRAASDGRGWLAAHGHKDTLENRMLAIGVVDLTRPATALELVLAGPARLCLDEVRAAAGPAPAGVVDLSDAALKAVCDRNGWLHGAPAERTAREVAERHVPAEVDGLRAALCADPPSALAALHERAPDDEVLDAHAYRKNPPSPEIVAAHRLLREAGREALRRFAEVDPPERGSLAEAFVHRFPARHSRDALREPDPSRLLAADQPQRPPAAAVALTFDLGL